LDGAGRPGANFALVILCIAAVRIGIATGAFGIPESVSFAHMVSATRPGLPDGLAQFLGILFSLNLMLGAFNLLPLPPLDGGTAVGLLFSERTALRIAEFSHNPMFSLVGIVVAWQLFGRLSGPIFHLGAVLLYPDAYSL